MRSKRLELQEALKNSTITKREEDLKKQKSSSKKPRAAFVDGPREKEIETDEVDESPNVVALEKQRSSATKPCLSSFNGRRAKGIAKYATVGERLSAAALEKESLTIKPHITFVHGRRGKEIVTDAVGESLNAVALEKQRSSTTKPCSEIANDSWANEIASIAVDARLNAVALKKKRSSTKKPCSAFVNGSRVDEIVTDPVDERFNAVADMLDAGNDIRGEDADKLDMESDIRDEDDSNMQIVRDQSLPPNSDEDADTIDSWNDITDEDAEILDLYEDKDIQIAEDQSLSTDSERVAGLPRKRKHDKVRRLVTYPHNESNNTYHTDNGQASTSRPSGNRRLIIFDKYGRPCDVGSDEFATDIGKIVRARCPPAIANWRIVPHSIKEDIWKCIVAKYVVPEVYKPNILSRAGTSWRNWKSALRVELDKHDTIAERKLNMPERFIRNREHWESFVDFCNTDEDRKRRAIGKKAREAVEFKQSCGRKGIYRKIYKLENESPTGEVNRSLIFLDTHVSKTINDPESSSISDIKMRLIKELVEANPDGQKDIDNDAVALVCGRDGKGVVRGMGGGVTRTTMRATAASTEILRKVQQENKSLKSDIQLLIAQSGKNTENHTFTPSNQSASQAPDASNLPARSRSSPDVSNVPARSRSAPRASNLPARSRLAPDASNLPARSRLSPDVSNFHSPSSSAPLASNFPARSSLAPPASNLPASSCFIKNFKGRTIALGSLNTAGPPMEHLYSIIIEDIFDRDAELFDKDGKLGDIVVGGVINWPKACVESNLPADSCFIRNFKRRTIAFGSFSTAADPQMEHVYSIVVKEIYDRDEELFDTDGKLGDVMIGGVINWPKACVKSC